MPGPHSGQQDKTQRFSSFKGNCQILIITAEVNVGSPNEISKSKPGVCEYEVNLDFCIAAGWRGLSARLLQSAERLEAACCGLDSPARTLVAEGRREGRPGLPAGGQHEGHLPAQ